MPEKKYFHKWSGLDSEFNEEAKQIKKLTKILKSWAKESETSTHLLTNFTYNGEEIDVTIILPTHFIVCDLKTGGGLVEGAENGDWTTTPLVKSAKNEKKPFKKIVNKNRKNPLRQADTKKWAFLKFLNDYENRIFSKDRLKNIKLLHALKSHVVFSEKVKWDKNQIPPGTMRTDVWFDVYSLDCITDKILYSKNNTHNLLLSEEEQWSISTLLNLRNDDAKHEFEDIDDKHSNLPEESISSYNLNGELISTQLVNINDDLTIIVEDKEGIRLKVHLNDYFLNTIHDLRKLSKASKQINKKEIDINLVNVRRENDNIYFDEKLESLLVIEPEWLINVTELASIDFCPRQLFNTRYSIQERFEAMTRGSIIHEVFEDILQDPENFEKLQGKLQESFSNRSFEFALDNIDYKGMEDSIRPHLNRLYKYRKENELISNINSVNTERFIINPVLGLKGKIDAVILDNNGQRALELKSGKKKWQWIDGRPTQKIAEGHRSQVQAYSLLMEMKSNTPISNPIVVYSGEEIEGRRIGENIEFAYNDKTQTMNKRNKLVLADYLLDIEYETINSNKCAKCSQLDRCANIFSLEQNHNPDNLPKFYTDTEKFGDIITDFPKKEKDFFHKYNQLLTEEYRIDKEAQGTYLLKTKIERIELGKTVLIDAYQQTDVNEYLLNIDNNSELREGDRCLLSDKNGPIYGECLEATIISVSRSSIFINTRAGVEFEPTYLDIYPQENIFARNYPMIYELIANKKNKKLKDFIINKNNPQPNRIIDIPNIGTLHKNQMLAIQYALGLEDYLLIQGPPGTGKTLTIAHIIEQLVKSDKKIIVGCYTHRAVDEVIKKLKNHTNFDFPIYRVGESTSEDINQYSIQSIVNKDDDIDIRIATANNILSQSGVYIATTHKWLSGGFDAMIKKHGKYDVAIIDEASQVIIPNAIGTLRLAEKFILVGDHKQLPPVVQSEEAQDLANTLFESLYDNKDAHESTKIMLDIQHRMPQGISDFISDEFYEKKLNTFEESSNDFLIIENKDLNYISVLNSKKPIELVDIKSSNNSRNQSTQEATAIKEILGDLLKAGIDYKEIGIIAPFRAQVAEIRRQIELDLIEYFEDPSDLKTVVDTVDRFQGDERDIIIFSLTIGEKSIPKLLQDKRRLNVAISRAKKKFIAVGDWEKALESDTLKNLKKYYEKL